MKNQTKGISNASLSSDVQETSGNVNSQSKAGSNSGKSRSNSKKNSSSSGKNGSNGKSGSSSQQTGMVKSSAEKTQTTIQEMFEDLLKDTYNAEKQLVKALPKVADAAYDEDLKNAIEDHFEETQQQVRRLEKIFQILRYNIESPTCEAMKGLIEESDEIIEEMEEGPVRDSALIIGAQKIEHYEMAAYGSLRTLAEVMGYYKVADILDRTLEEEENADQTLNEIAEYINLEALEISMESEYQES